MELLYPDWRAKVVFSPEGPRPQVLMENAGFKVVLAGLEPGQKIPVHPEGAGVFNFLEGEGWMQVGDQRFPIKPGTIILAPAGAPRGMEAETRLAFLAARAA